MIDERAYLPRKPWKASLVKGGKAYELVRDIPPAPLPGWIADLLDPPARPVPPPPSPIIALRPGYVRAAVEGELANVISAPPSRGNQALNDAALKLGRFVAGGQLERGQLEDMLAEAAMHGGRRGEAETIATIRSGLDAALRIPG